jgi:hypothetical protein
MSKSPDHRFQTAGEVAEALRQWLATRGKGPAPPEATTLSDSGRMPTLPRRRQPSTPPPRRNRPAGLDDTVADVDQATIKGSGRSPVVKNDDSSQYKNKLPVARPLHDSSGNFDFLTNPEPTVRPRSEPASDKGKRDKSDSVRAKRLSAKADSDRARPARQQELPQYWWAFVLGGLLLTIICLTLLYKVLTRPVTPVETKKRPSATAPAKGAKESKEEEDRFKINVKPLDKGAK